MRWHPAVRRRARDQGPSHNYKLVHQVHRVGVGARAMACAINTAQGPLTNSCILPFRLPSSYCSACKQAQTHRCLSSGGAAAHKCVRWLHPWSAFVYFVLQIAQPVCVACPHSSLYISHIAGLASPSTHVGLSIMIVSIDCASFALRALSTSACTRTCARGHERTD